MEKIEIVAEWLVFSDRDLATAQHLFQNMHPKKKMKAQPKGEII